MEQVIEDTQRQVANHRGVACLFKKHKANVFNFKAYPVRFPDKVTNLHQERYRQLPFTHIGGAPVALATSSDIAISSQFLYEIEIQLGTLKK